jgi:hypothetical protein
MGSTGDKMQATKPITVMGATKGSAITLAKIEYTGIVGRSNSKTGKHAICAANETETNIANQRGILF